MVRILLMILLASALGACHSSRSVTRGSAGSTVTTGTTRSSVDADVARSLVDCARGWIGTPYCYGGNDRRGVDCSGLTSNVFLQAAGVKLPRDSRSQKDYCRRIDRKVLQPGDLVFFVSSKGGKRVNHVGLYIGGGEMIHASSSRGVMVSDITSGYWDSHYFSSGRVEAVTYAARGSKPGGGSKGKKGKNNKKKSEPVVPKVVPSKPNPLPMAEITPPTGRPSPVAEIHFPSEPLPVVVPPAPQVEETDSVQQSAWFD